MNIPHPRRKTLCSIAATLGIIGGAVFVGIVSEILREVCTVIIAHQSMSLAEKVGNHFNLFGGKDA